MDPQGIQMMRCHTWSTSIEILSAEDGDDVMYFIATSPQREWFRVTRSRDVSRDESPRLTSKDVATRTHHSGWPPRSEGGAVLLVPLTLDQRGRESQPLPERWDESERRTRGEGCEGRGKGTAEKLLFCVDSVDLKPRYAECSNERGEPDKSDDDPE